VRGGLPAAVIGKAERIREGLLVTLEQGGVYISSDGTGNWTRLDRDAERGQMNGFVEIRPGELLFGSQSEGLLRSTDSGHP